jgi:hypothetical protein
MAITPFNGVRISWLTIRHEPSLGLISLIRALLGLGNALREYAYIKRKHEN